MGRLDRGDGYPGVDLQQRDQFAHGARREVSSWCVAHELVRDSGPEDGAGELAEEEVPDLLVVVLERDDFARGRADELDRREGRLLEGERLDRRGEEVLCGEHHSGVECVADGETVNALGS